MSSASQADPFEAHRLRVASGGELPYRLLRPLALVLEPGRSYPLVIFLHGSGERGRDNERQLTLGAREFTAPALRAQHPCFVLAPQCAEGQRWVEVAWGAPLPHETPAEPSAPMRLLIELIAALEQEPGVDAARIYLVGVSMGAFGVWDLLARFPDRFAAAVSICGGADDRAAPRLAHLPVWVFHGSKDTAVRPERSRSMVEALKAAGSRLVRYSEYPGVGHRAWDRAFAEPELFDWLFSQAR